MYVHVCTVSDKKAFWPKTTIFAVLAGLPNGFFSNQNTPTWVNFEGLRLENVEIFKAIFTDI
jgi:hypothetical protein